MTEAAVDTAIIDVDGTLVDSNYQHALAWYRAFREFGLIIPGWRIHRHIGMGGDQLVGAVAGADIEERHGEALREAWTANFKPMMGEIVPLPGATALLTELRESGLQVVLASSGEPEQTEHYVDLLAARAIVHAWTNAQDVAKTKPAPDLLAVALERADGSHPVMIGDSPWDCVAAERLGVPAFGLLSGGFATSELRDAGARQVFDSPEDLLAHLGETPLGSKRGAGGS